MKQVTGRLLRQARALAQRHEPTSKELKLARHLAQNGYSYKEIGECLGWSISPNAVGIKLKKFGIFSRRYATGLKSRFSGNSYFAGKINMQDYRPKVISKLK